MAGDSRVEAYAGVLGVEGRAVGVAAREVPLYLHHQPFQLALAPVLVAWHRVVRIAVSAVVGVIGATAISAGGLRLLGSRWGRRVLGV